MSAITGSYMSNKCRRKNEARKLVFVVLFLVYLGVVCASLILKKDFLKELKFSKEEDNVETRLHRYKRESSKESDKLLNDDKPEKNCTPRAIEEFPDNFLTVQQTKDGGMAIHIFLSLYMFGALAIVCDDYFVSSLEVICDRLNIQEDVAGATFMAAGSSAPEFFTSVIGVFIAKSDVGVGTIVGSAVFNILFIIGACAISAGMIVHLTWYPMTRDCLFYLISIAGLVIAINDEKVYWYEATIFVVLYIIYIIIMYFNRYLEDRCKILMHRLRKKLRGKDADHHHHHHHVEIDEKQPLSENSSGGTYTDEKLSSAAGSIEKDTVIDGSVSSEEEGNKHVAIDDKPIDSPWDIPEHWLAKIYWVVMLPVKVILFVTVPDCRKHGIWRRLYMLTFTMSIVWIAAFSYLMVWMVTIVGDVLEIPDTVMGLTILAAGTSVPDCLSSIFVARDGYGDMAVSNSIGSNVFDILICLGIPWLLDTAIVKKGDPLLINSGGITYSSLILLSTVAFMLLAINLAKWKLTKPFGALCMIAYAAVITVSCLFELNVFGEYVAPSCPRT